MRYRTLCKNKEFSRVYARGKSYVHPHMVLYVAKNRLGHTRIDRPMIPFDPEIPAPTAAVVHLAGGA